MAAESERDYFTDYSVLKDPYEYFEQMRSRGPVYRSSVRDIVVVTGFAEAVEVLNNTKDFSSVMAVQGPALPLPFEPEGDSIDEQIETHRSQFRSSDLLVTFDGKQHTNLRSILSRLFTPSKLKANEEFIADYSEQLVTEALARGGCELINQISTPFVTLVIADLLGVPADDRETFRQFIDNAPPPGNMETEGAGPPSDAHPLVFMGKFFYEYVTDRRANPRADVLTELATATYPDGTMPDVLDVVRLAVFLFGAGQDTSAKLLGNSMRFIAEDKELQKKLREDKKLLPSFIEEVLRLEGSTKMTPRLARRNTRIGDAEIAAGTKIMVALAAANRDPRRWENPAEFDMARPRLREHLAFGRGAHVCAGAPLARVEVRMILERFLEHTTEISLNEEEHGPQGARTLDYEPSFIIRGLSKLHLKLK